MAGEENNLEYGRHENFSSSTLLVISGQMICMLPSFLECYELHQLSWTRSLIFNMNLSNFLVIIGPSVSFWVLSPPSFQKIK